MKRTHFNDRPKLDGEHHKVSFESMPWESPAPGVRFKACEHNGSRLRLVEFTKDFIEPDWCVKGHIGYVLEGEIEVDFCGKAMVLFRAGDGLFIPPGSEHGHKARVQTDSVTLVLVEECGT
jgi:quercetin dioxygenase-like cupin family protein